MITKHLKNFKKLSLNLSLFPYFIQARLIAYGQGMDHGVGALSPVAMACNKENERYFNKHEMEERDAREMESIQGHALKPNVLVRINYYSNNFLDLSNVNVLIML